jgi:hypothetical protein
MGRDLKLFGKTNLHVILISALTNPDGRNLDELRQNSKESRVDVFEIQGITPSKHLLYIKTY